MWVKRLFLLAIGAGTVVPLWSVGHSGGTASAIGTAIPQRATFTNTLAAMQSDIVRLQAKNQQAEASLQKLQAEAMTWKNQNKKLVTLLQTARTENVTLQNAVLKWQAAASQPQVHTVTGASGQGRHGDGGDGFGD